MGQLRPTQLPGQQQAEEPGVGHVRGQIGGHLPFRVDPIGGFIDAGHKRRGRVQVVGDIVGYGYGGHFVSRCRIDCRLRYTGGNTVSKETFTAGFLDDYSAAVPGANGNPVIPQQFHAQQRLVN